MSSQTSLLIVHFDKQSNWHKRVEDLVQQLGEEDELLVFFTGRVIEQTCKADILRLLTALYEQVGKVAPRANVIPLFSFCQWDLASIASTFHPEKVYMSKQSRANDLAAELQKVINDIPRWTPSFELQDDDNLCYNVDESTHSRRFYAEMNTPSSTSYSTFTGLCVGGTFDRLHAGHRLLLSAAVALCSECLYLGITADELLQKKKNRELLQCLSTRKESVLQFIASVNPHLKVAVGKLQNDKPLAVSSKDITCIVVSRETVSGAQWINTEREKNSLEPLAIIAVNLVGATSQVANAQKLSSSALREEEVENSNKKRKKIN